MADQAENTIPEDVGSLFAQAVGTLPSADLGPTIEAVRRLVEDHFTPKPIVLVDAMSGTAAPGQVTRSGITSLPAAVFDDYLEAPRRRVGKASLTDLDSLIAHVNRFKDGDSILFANDDREAPSITAVLDYHRAGSASAPRFGGHRSLFHFPLADEWTAWMAADNVRFRMGEFGAFLEDRVIDVREIGQGEALPDDLARFITICGGSVATPTKLIELSRGMKVLEKSAVKEARNLSSGEGEISFAVEHTDEFGGKLNTPGLFLIGIPVFKGGPAYRLAARLRYRKQPDGLVFFFELWRADRTFDHAFREACKRAQEETGLPLLFGSPE